MPVNAQTIYPTQRCRVYYDTAYIQIPGQCGTVMPFYPRKLFVRTSRQPVYYDYSYCCRYWLAALRLLTCCPQIA